MNNEGFGFLVNLWDFQTWPFTVRNCVSSFSIKIIEQMKKRKKKKKRLPLGAFIASRAFRLCDITANLT